MELAKKGVWLRHRTQVMRGTDGILQKVFNYQRCFDEIESLISKMSICRKTYDTNEARHRWSYPKRAYGLGHVTKVMRGTDDSVQNILKYLWC